MKLPKVKQAHAEMRSFRVSKRTKKAFYEHGRIHGSAGRALQVGMEIVYERHRAGNPVRIPPGVAPADSLFACGVMPRTDDLIKQLTPVYGSIGKVLWACILGLDDLMYS